MEGEAEKVTEEEEFEFRARLEAEQGKPGGRQIVEPDAFQRRMGIRKNRYKDENLAGNVGRGILDFGQDMGREATLLTTGMGASPDVANAAGFAANAAADVAPLGRVGGAAKAVVEPLAEPAAKRVMQAALKPTSKSLVNGDAARAIDTMLAEGVNATTGGAAKLRLALNKLKGEVGEVIMNSPATVDKNLAYKELASTLDEVSKKGAGYTADRNAVVKAWEEFKAHPLLQGAGDQVPIQAADTVKRASQKAAESAYGALTPPTAADKANMAIASGLRQGMEAAEPQVAAMNAKLSEYINALHQIEPRAAQQANSEIFGLAPIAGSAEGAMLALAQRNPWLKSYVAQVLHRGEIPAGAARIGTVGAEGMQ
jgi:hypothetical protein